MIYYISLDCWKPILLDLLCIEMLTFSKRICLHVTTCTVLDCCPLFWRIWHQNHKDTQMYHLSTVVKSTTQLQAGGYFTLILGYELCSLLKTVTVKCRTAIKAVLCVCLSVRLDSFSCSFTSISFLTNHSPNQSCTCKSTVTSEVP